MPDDIDDMPDVPLNLDGSRDAEVTETTVETPEVKETDKPEETTKTDEKTTEGEQKPAEKQEPVEDEAAKQRAENARYAAQRVQERQRIKEETARKLDATYGPKTAEQLVEEGVDPAQAEIQALRQEVQYSNDRAAISELNAGMQAEAVNVQYDFPVYRELNADGSKNPDYDPDFSAKVEAGYQRRANVSIDKDTGLVLSANESLYDYYKEMAEYRQAGASHGASQGQAEMQEMLSRTEDATGGSSSGNKHSETLEEMGERLADVPIY